MAIKEPDDPDEPVGRFVAGDRDEEVLLLG